MLNVLDNLWTNHLEDMEYLRDSVRLRAYGQRDPLVEYKNESQKLFRDLMQNFESQVVMMIFKVGITQGSSPSPSQVGPKVSPQSDDFVKNGDQIGRNDPCHCGSGKKYKRCHGA